MRYRWVTRGTCRVKGRKFEVKRSLGTLKSRREDNIKTDFQVIGVWVNTIRLVRFGWSVGWLAGWLFGSFWSICFVGRPSGSWAI
jgi:hypothetical protein